jgi:hypothetical protein
MKVVSQMSLSAVTCMTDIALLKMIHVIIQANAVQLDNTGVMLMKVALTMEEHAAILRSLKHVPMTHILHAIQFKIIVAHHRQNGVMNQKQLFHQ